MIPAFAGTSLVRKPVPTLAFARACFSGLMLYWWSMIFSENRCPLFGIMLYWWSMIFSENRCPLFGIML